MIVDISNELYTEVKNALDITFYKNYPKDDPVFPCGVMTFNTSSTLGTIDSSGEKHNSQFIDINIFTQSETSNEDIKEIRFIIDGILADKYRMSRMNDEEMENRLDRTINRWFMRYGYTVSYDKKIYRG